SRRRHTRSYGDWSSDVCSSDLDLWRDPDFRDDLMCLGHKSSPSPLGERGKMLTNKSARHWPKMQDITSLSFRSQVPFENAQTLRSEERRVGKECRARRMHEH